MMIMNNKHVKWIYGSIPRQLVTVQNDTLQVSRDYVTCENPEMSVCLKKCFHCQCAEVKPTTRSLL